MVDKEETPNNREKGAQVKPKPKPNGEGEVEAGAVEEPLNARAAVDEDGCEVERDDMNEEEGVVEDENDKDDEKAGNGLARARAGARS